MAESENENVIFRSTKRYFIKLKISLNVSRLTERPHFTNLN